MIIDDLIQQVTNQGFIDQAFRNSLAQSGDIGKAIVSIAEARGIGGFVFNCPQEENVEMKSDITDYYLDNNQPANDFIVKKPITIRLTGYQGDYLYKASVLNAIREKLTNSLPVLNEILPKIEIGVNVLQTYGSVISLGINKIKDFVTSGGNFKVFNGADLFLDFTNAWKLNNNQTQAFLYLENLWQNNVMMTVETTWKRYDNMAITDLSIKRDSSLDITDISVTLKQVNILNSSSKSVYGEVVTGKLKEIKEKAGKVAEMSANIIDKGLDAGKEAILTLV